jgi:SIR2-like domain
VSLSWPPALVQAIARRRAVVLIGSGVSANARTDAGAQPPTWGEFLKNSYKKLGRRIPHIASALTRYSYLEACDYLKGEYKERWPEVIRESFVTPQFRPSDIHKAIFDLDCRIVASLNFDKIYETYAIPASENTIVVKNYYDDDVRQTVAGTDRYIIKPHGTVDTISRMIFTLDDYAHARIKHSSFYEMMTALLHTHTFLCIGCGLSDPDMKLIFEDYRYKYSESPHYITLPSPLSTAEAALIQKTRGLNVLNYSPKDHHKELTKSLFELGEAVSLKRDEIAELQSW